jgi:hypothetical protein
VSLAIFTNLHESLALNSAEYFAGGITKSFMIKLPFILGGTYHHNCRTNFLLIIKKKRQPFGRRFFLVAGAGFEPAT